MTVPFDRAFLTEKLGWGGRAGQGREIHRSTDFDGEVRIHVPDGRGLFLDESRGLAIRGFPVVCGAATGEDHGKANGGGGRRWMDRPWTFHTNQATEWAIDAQPGRAFKRRFRRERVFDRDGRKASRMGRCQMPDPRCQMT